MSFNSSIDPGFIMQRRVKTSRSQNYFIISLFLLLGCLFVVIGVWQGIKSLQLSTAGIHATGVVKYSQVKISRNPNGTTATSYDTAIDFQSSDGVEHEFHSQIQGVPGQNLDVIYLKEKPDVASVFSFSGMWLIPSGFILLGGIFSFVMLYCAVNMRKREQESDRLVSLGVRIAGTIIGVVQTGQWSQMVNGAIVQMYEIIVKTAETTPSELKSDNIQLNIASVAALVGKELPVYIEPGNPSSYFVDLRSIEQYDINLAPNNQP